MVAVLLGSQLRNYLQDGLRPAYVLVIQHLHQQGWRTDMQRPAGDSIVPPSALDFYGLRSWAPL